MLTQCTGVVGVKLLYLFFPSSSCCTSYSHSSILVAIYEKLLKELKSEVGMAVLKSKQTRAVEIFSTYIVHPYACFSHQILPSF